MNRMQERYQKEVVPALRKSIYYKNIMQVPHIEKVVVNIGLGGEAMDNPKMLEAAMGDMTIITGQKPVMTKARKSIANFKLREGPHHWHQGYLARRQNVGLPGPVDEHCSAARA